MGHRQSYHQVPEAVAIVQSVTEPVNGATKGATKGAVPMAMLVQPTTPQTREVADLRRLVGAMQQEIDNLKANQPMKYPSSTRRWQYQSIYQQDQWHDMDEDDAAKLDYEFTHGNMRFMWQASNCQKYSYWLDHKPSHQHNGIGSQFHPQTKAHRRVRFA